MRNATSPESSPTECAHAFVISAHKRPPYFCPGGGGGTSEYATSGPDGIGNNRHHVRLSHRDLISEGVAPPPKKKIQVL